MSITVELSPETEAALRPIAARRGLDLSELIAEFANREAAAAHSYSFPPPDAAIAHRATTNTVEEKLAALKELQKLAEEWNLPAPAPNAYDRELLYDDEK